METDQILPPTLFGESDKSAWGFQPEFADYRKYRQYYRNG